MHLVAPGSWKYFGRAIMQSGNSQTLICFIFSKPLIIIKILNQILVWFHRERLVVSFYRIKEQMAETPFDYLFSMLR